MKPKKQAIVVEYYSDPTKMVDDHESESINLTEINKRWFENEFEAIRFLDQCIEPITKVEDIISIDRKPKNFKLILPDRNIKIKHQVSNDLDTTFTFDDDRDTWK